MRPPIEPATLGAPVEADRQAMPMLCCTGWRMREKYAPFLPGCAQRLNLRTRLGSIVRETPALTLALSRKRERGPTEEDVATHLTPPPQRGEGWGEGAGYQPNTQRERQISALSLTLSRKRERGPTEEDVATHSTPSPRRGEGWGEGAGYQPNAQRERQISALSLTLSRKRERGPTEENVAMHLAPSPQRGEGWGEGAGYQPNAQRERQSSALSLALSRKRERAKRIKTNTTVTGTTLTR